MQEPVEEFEPWKNSLKFRSTLNFNSNQIKLYHLRFIVDFNGHLEKRFWNFIVILPRRFPIKGRIRDIEDFDIKKSLPIRDALLIWLYVVVFNH